MNKTPEPKNTRAVNLFQSWLKALSIPYRPAESPADISVTTKDGKETLVQLKASDSPEVGSPIVVIASELITGRNIQNAFDVFQGFVEALGYEYKPPVDRGAKRNKKVYTKDDFELGALRHADLRRVPNPSNDELKRFSPIINKVSNWFLTHYQELCDDNMLSIDDLKTYASMWTVAYLGMYRVKVVTDCDDEKKLTAHLKQRYQELRDLLHKKGRNVFVNLDEAHIAICGTPFNYTNTFGSMRTVGMERSNREKEQFLSEKAVDETVDKAYVERRSELNLKSDSARRESAKDLLARLLSELPHDGMVECLREASSNDRLDVTARKEAAKQLRTHCMICAICLASKPAEETTEDDSLGVLEEI